MKSSLLFKLFGQKNLLTSTKSLFILGSLLALHIALSIYNENFSWLGAFGSLLTIYALLLGFTHSVYPTFEEDIKPPVSKNEHGIWVEKPLGYGLLAYEIEDDEIARATNLEHQDLMSIKYSILITIYYTTIAGTLLATYSSFIPYFYIKTDDYYNYLFINKEYIMIHLNLADFGLLIDLIAVLMLAKYSIPNKVLFSDGRETLEVSLKDAQRKNNIKEYKKCVRITKIGYSLLFVGLLLQSSLINKLLT